MTELVEHTKEVPGPLDGMETAKPGEPVFTLQGGDPLGARLVRLWAFGARVRAGIVQVEKWTGDAVFNEFLDAAKGAIAHDKKKDELLVRATEAESISWDMDRYRRNEPAQVEEKITEGYGGYEPDESLVEKMTENRERLETGRRVSNATGELFEAAEIARKYGLEDDAVALLRTVELLKGIGDRIRPQRRGGPAYD